MSAGTAALLLGGTVLSASGCRRRAAVRDVELQCRVEPAPPRTGPARVIVTLAHLKQSGPVKGAKVSVEGNMAHPGMVPVFGTATETQPGRYEAPLTLTMGGDWVLSVTARLPDGRRLRRDVPLPGVKGP